MYLTHMHTYYVVFLCRHSIKTMYAVYVCVFRHSPAWLPLYKARFHLLIF